MGIKDFARICATVMLLPLLAFLVFTDAQMPYKNSWLGRLAIKLKLV